MTNNNREELIATITKLLAALAETEAAQSASGTSANEPPTPAAPAPPDTVEMLTIKECSKTVKGLNEYTVRQLVTRGEIPSVRCGKGERGKILVPKTALLNYFNGAGNGRVV